MDHRSHFPYPSLAYSQARFQALASADAAVMRAELQRDVVARRETLLRLAHMVPEGPPRGPGTPVLRASALEAGSFPTTPPLFAAAAPSARSHHATLHSPLTTPLAFSPPPPLSLGGSAIGDPSGSGGVVSGRGGTRMGGHAQPSVMSPLERSSGRVSPQTPPPEGEAGTLTDNATS